MRAGEAMDRANKAGRTAYLRYKGGVLGEEPLDDRSTGDPLAVVIGTMQLPRGVEEAVVGMEVGEVRSIEVPPELGYGAYQDKLASWHLKGMVEHGYDLKAGDVVFWTNPDDGRRMPAWVTEETADMVKLDFNHPFAGKTLAYWVELVDLR